VLAGIIDHQFVATPDHFTIDIALPVHRSPDLMAIDPGASYPDQVFVGYLNIDLQNSRDRLGDLLGIFLYILQLNHIGISVLY
jgi:hypothetical protein